MGIMKQYKTYKRRKGMLFKNLTYLISHFQYSNTSFFVTLH
jgi:hypothetical protein